jgi:hypothetical protein
MLLQIHDMAFSGQNATGQPLLVMDMHLMRNVYMSIAPAVFHLSNCWPIY